MITKTNFKNLLHWLGFTEKSTVFSNKIHGFLMQADFSAERLIYPKGVRIEGDFTTNFSSAENFVVFECVHRLLELGYKPEQLTLEPKWKLGHGASGGRADIVISDNDGKIFPIIECKTAGKEFNDAWDIGLQFPSQLFSYAQQEGSTQLLCLYTSDFTDGKPERHYFIITLKDNEELLQTMEDPEVLKYEKAQRFDEKFNVWKETYLNEAYSIGFFEDDIQPFHFGRKNYSLNDLKEISHTDIQKKYHQFATILRKYNVSGRENAFDKLVNLFLCKVVDEQQNPTNLNFFWKGRAYDNDFELQDRLQRLYQQGMKQFLNEDVTYINREQIDEAFRFLEKDNDPDATKATIHKFFIQLKFFTNNDFAFIDVHNERLFQENAVVLRSIVEMLQDIKLKSESENSGNQFLGDMFEGFLDAGIKQSEGQFFTPMPIVKFIINSLPLEDVLAKSDEPPKAIDYACGAGHFLTELARQIKPLVQQYKKADISEYYHNITGIEKEYRLSKVAKVSAFMYGQDDIQIIYADALAKNELIQNGAYNILVANPPYSVKGFLETLTHPDRKAFELFGGIDGTGILTNNSIETFFIERAKQLLAPDGVVAIILPSSVLSNDAQQYRQTRQILLQHFHIIAIAELGSGTFGKTGTNTVTLFLRRRKQNPAEAEHFKYRAQCWIDGDVSPRTKKNKQYNDLHLLEGYCTHINIPFADYKYFLTEAAPNEALIETEIWEEYEKAFYESTEIKNHQKKPYFKNLSKEAKKEDLNELLYRRIRNLEVDKLYYFLLANSNSVPVLIIKSPADNKAMKRFLGYEWSSAKGNEGIKYLNTAPVATSEDEPVLITAQLNAIRTPMYNAAKKEDATKLNYYINENFLGRSFTLPEELAEFAHTSKLTDMLDFNRKDFSKAISLSGKKMVEIVSKFNSLKLGEIVSNIGGLWTGKRQPFLKAKVIRNTNFGKNGVLDISNVAEIEVEVNQFNNRKLQKGDIIIEKSGGSETQAVGRVVMFDFDDDVFSFSNFTARLRIVSKNVESEFLILVLNDFYNKGYTFNFQSGSSGLKNLDLQKYLEIKIPVPPIKVQQSIVNECRKVDEAVNEANKNIENAKEEIEKKVEEFFHSNFPLKNLKQIAGINPSKSEIKDLEDDMMVSFVEMASVSNDGFIENKEDRHLKTVRKGSYTYFAENDIIIAKITPCMENGKCALAKSLSNSIALGSSEFHVIRPTEDILPEYLFYHLNRKKIRLEAEKKMTGSSGHRRVPISFYENIKIPVPPLSIQGKLVKKVGIFQAQIASAQNIIQQAPTQKQQVLKKWLE